MYLSEVEEGGETVFPAAKGNFSAVPWWNELSECGKGGLSVKPKMGDAFLFWSMKPDATIDPSSLHGGCGVLWKGTNGPLQNGYVCGLIQLAKVGTLLGAMTGALIGQETESGFVRGAAVGAISGAVFSIEVFESSLVLWHSDESGLGCLLYLIDVIASLLSGRLVRERIGPAMLSAVQSQMGAVETSFEEVQNIFDVGGAKGLAGDSVEKIPKIRITRDNNVDASGEKVCCSVCLQDFQLGETVRSLPQCHHMFHLPCIDKWLVRHGSCPLCRRDL